MDNVNLEDEIRTRKEKILRLKNEIKILKDAKGVITGVYPSDLDENSEKAPDDNEE